MPKAPSSTNAPSRIYLDRIYLIEVKSNRTNASPKQISHNDNRAPGKPISNTSQVHPIPPNEDRGNKKRLPLKHKCKNCPVTCGVFDRYKAHLTASGDSDDKVRVAKYFFCHFDVHNLGGECDINAMLRQLALFKLFEYLNNRWKNFGKHSETIRIH